MDVGAADPGAIHLDQHIIDPDDRFRDILEPETRSIVTFDESFHGANNAADSPRGRDPILSYREESKQK